MEGHSIDDDDDYDHTHLHPDPRATEEEEGPPDPRQMSMAEAFVSMYSDSTSSDSELNNDDDNDLTSVTQISLSPSSVYDYTPSPPNRSRSYPPHYNSLTRQKLVYSPTKSVSGDSESKDTYFSSGCNDDSALYTTAVEESESFAVNRSTIVMGRAKSVVGGANSVDHRDSESFHVADSSLEDSYAAERSIRCREREKEIDLLCDDFSNLITSTNQIRQTTSAAARPTPPSKTRQSRLTDSSHHSVRAGRTNKSEQCTTSTPTSLGCSFAADIQVKIPEKLRSLTESELRERLVALGERPGPITPSTKIAYIAYLAKLEAGIQPAGNKGYKGE
ncbi:MAG: hypothetical protein MJE68_11765 [Proteobacteria bacterium]|nr:hypothetical protein [Pseudomonadota bacterium]